MKRIDDIGQELRAFVWGVLILAIFALGVQHYLGAKEPILDAFEEPQAFWPPDLVPHPGAPHIVPEYDPNDPEDERNWA